MRTSLSSVLARPRHVEATLILLHFFPKFHFIKTNKSENYLFNKFSKETVNFTGFALVFKKISKFWKNFINNILRKNLIII